MILVDSSVLIDYFKGKENAKSLIFQKVLENSLPYGINKFIYLELLQGARSINEFKILKKYLESLRFYSLKQSLRSFDETSLIFIKCRSAGVTIRSSIDLLVAQTAIENNLMLLHNDSDFNHMAKVIKELEIY